VPEKSLAVVKLLRLQLARLVEPSAVRYKKRQATETETATGAPCRPGSLQIAAAEALLLRAQLEKPEVAPPQNRERERERTRRLRSLPPRGQIDWMPLPIPPSRPPLPRALPVPPRRLPRPEGALRPVVRPRRRRPTPASP
jgi:hypothetical protein